MALPPGGTSWAGLRMGGLQTREVYRFPNGVTERDGHLTWDVKSLLSHVKDGIRMVHILVEEDDAVMNKTVCSYLNMDFHAMVLTPGLPPMQQDLLDKHYLRKHRRDAYYGQG